MLTELSIRNFTIIDEISIQFQEGLTVLTGETGAGKSIIIDAIQLLIGGRGSVEFVRHKSKKADLEGLFIIDDQQHPVFSLAEQYGITLSEGELVLERTITNRGRSICRVNGKLVTLAILREIGSHLVDIHTQHETQSLMDSSYHIELLDHYNFEQIQKAKEEYLLLYHKLVKLKKRYRELSENEQKMAHRLDLLEFQYNEIEQAELQPDEDILLEKEREQLANFERIHQAISEAYNALYGENKGLDWFHIAQQSLQGASDYDAFIKEKAEALTNTYYNIEEMTYDLRQYLDELSFNPEQLNVIEARLNEIDRLKKKYGPSVIEILDYMGKVAEEIEQITHKDSHLQQLAYQITELEKDAYLEAKQLHELRVQAAESLTDDIHQAFKELFLEHAKFQVTFESHDKFTIDKRTSLHENGFDQVHFYISTNPGEPLKELNKIASGGELSRIMLALKGIFAKQEQTTSVIFDEVDTGVSGRVAQAMADKIHHISNDSQVLCITHLPQVAAMADTHLFIQKMEKQGRTVTAVTELNKIEKVDELSRMLTGSQLTETAIQHATELLELAEKRKK
ncbi:MAG TPA: DNA repair protein RecN [Cerasibacillus sp.]|uniref:DNA repair protein RecN n=1 Tax=Cerasibacillus sp. TaxID=2498711 RepID=UPI002F42F77D